MQAVISDVGQSRCSWCDKEGETFTLTIDDRNIRDMPLCWKHAKEQILAAKRQSEEVDEPAGEED